jgi:O-antigen/teichoic acid export membrane protein
VGVVALVNVALNLVAIPRWGMVGACGATVLSEALCFVLLFIAFRRAVPGMAIGRAVVPPVAAGALGGVTLMLAAPWLPPGPLGLALGATAALAGFTGALMILRAIGREDLTMLRELMPPRSAR